MTVEEAKKAIDGLKADGLTEEEIVVVFHDMYRNNKITAEEFGELVELVGYELTEEFYNMSEEERKECLYDEVDDVDHNEPTEKIKNNELFYADNDDNYEKN